MNELNVVDLTEIAPEDLVGDTSESECECERKDMTEQKYLELAEAMKGVIEEKDRQIKKAQDRERNYRNTLCKIYGVLRMCVDIIGACDFGEPYTDTIQNCFDYMIDQMKETLDIS